MSQLLVCSRTTFAPDVSRLRSDDEDAEYKMSPYVVCPHLTVAAAAATRLTRDRLSYRSDISVLAEFHEVVDDGTLPPAVLRKKREEARALTPQRWRLANIVKQLVASHVRVAACTTPGLLVPAALTRWHAGVLLLPRFGFARGRWNSGHCSQPKRTQTVTSPWRRRIQAVFPCHSLLLCRSTLPSSCKGRCVVPLVVRLCPSLCAHLGAVTVVCGCMCACACACAVCLCVRLCLYVWLCVAV